MQTENRLLDDLARVATGAIGVAAGVRGEIEARLRDQFEKVLAQMDLVTRDEFEAVKQMAAKAREEQERLGERLAELEARLAGESGAPGGRTRRRAAKRGAPESGAGPGGGPGGAAPD